MSTEFWIYWKAMLDTQYIQNSAHMDKVKYCFQTLEVATMLRTALRQHHTVLRQLQELRIDTSPSPCELNFGYIVNPC